MSIRRLHLLIAAATFALVLLTNPSTTHASDDWETLAPPDEEIAVQIPGRPVVRNFPIWNQRDPKAEKVLAHHAYDGYGSGLVYVIDSFRAEHPEKLSAQNLSLVDQQGIFERLFFDGVAAELFRNTVTHRYAPYSKRTLRLVTAKHLYIIQLMALEEFSPAVDQFLSSLKMRKADDQGVPIALYTVASGGPILNRNEVTRPAIIVWRSEPWYTEAARAKQTKGTVVLDLIFADNGYVTGITTVQGLENGLTESAIEAAQNIRFFPAEKDGKPVSQRNRVEFSFNIY